MTTHILGLGPSLKRFSKDLASGKTIGVNDIWRYYPVDFLVCADKPDRFPSERLKYIQNAKPKNGFFTHVRAWETHPYYKIIQLARKRSDLSVFDWDNVPYSTNSPFIACCIAYLLGATEIIMWGVDLTNHPQLNHNGNEVRTFDDYKRLHKELCKRGCNLMVGSRESALSEFIPIYETEKV